MTLTYEINNSTQNSIIKAINTLYTKLSPEKSLLINRNNFYDLFYFLQLFFEEKFKSKFTFHGPFKTEEEIIKFTSELKTLSKQLNFNTSWNELKISDYEDEFLIFLTHVNENT